jgi:type II secretory ATPase GspE/PulE/Tfp pilus assembly ATPase PilB-like protein
MDSLRDAALRKLADGVTTFEEVARVTADTE